MTNDRSIKRRNVDCSASENVAPTESRRRMLRTLAGVGGVGIAGLAGCLGGDEEPGDAASSVDDESDDDVDPDGDLADDIVVQIVGGHYLDSYEQKVFDLFEDEYGVTVEVDVAADQFDGYAQISTGQSDADVAITSATTLYNGAVDGNWATITEEDVPNYANLLDTFKDPVYDPDGGVHGVPVVYGTVGMGYNRDELGEQDSWAACWDEAYDGQITMQGTDFVRVFTTALYLEMNPNEIEVDGSYEAGIDLIWDTVREQRDLVNRYWETGDDHVRMFAEGEALVGEAWGGRIHGAVMDGHDHLDYVVPQEGAYGWSDNWTVVGGLPDDRHRTALAFLDFMLEDDILVPLCEMLGYPPSTGATSDEIEELYDFDPTGGDRLMFLDKSFRDEHIDDWSETWETVQAE